MGVLVPIPTLYDGLLEILFEALRLSPVNHSMVIKYTFELRCSTVRILNECDIKFYLELKKNEPDMTKFPLCVDIILELMTMTNQRISIQSSHYRVHSCQMHYRNPSSIQNPNPNPDSNSVSYYPEMPSREDPDLNPVESPAQGNPPMVFATECVGDGLEDHPQFNTPL